MLTSFEAACRATLVHPGTLLSMFPPIESRGIHRKTWSNRAVSSDDHVVLAGTAVPVGEMQLAARVVGDAWCVTQHCGDIAIGARAIAVPAILLGIDAG